MCPSSFRIRLTFDEAVVRLAKWARVSEILRQSELSGIEARKVAIDDSTGEYRGTAVLVAEIDGWTVFEEISRDFSGIAPEAWLHFAQKDDFLFLGYNDAVPLGELIAIHQGKIVRDFYEDSSRPKRNRNAGQLTAELVEDLEISLHSGTFIIATTQYSSDRRSHKEIYESMIEEQSRNPTIDEIQNWIDVAFLVDEDEFAEAVDQGMLWVFEMQQKTIKPKKETNEEA